MGSQGSQVAQVGEQENSVLTTIKVNFGGSNPTPIPSTINCAYPTLTTVSFWSIMLVEYPLPSIPAHTTKTAILRRQ